MHNKDKLSETVVHTNDGGHVIVVVYGDASVEVIGASTTHVIQPIENGEFVHAPRDRASLGDGLTVVVDTTPEKSYLSAMIGQRAGSWSGPLIDVKIDRKKGQIKFSSKRTPRPVELGPERDSPGPSVG